jgi:hypothetical protein
MPAQVLKRQYRRKHPAINVGAHPRDAQNARKIRLVLSSVELAFHAQALHLLGPSRGGRHLARARQTMQYLAHCALSISYADLALLTQRDRTSIAHACRTVENLRDDPQFDKALYFMELALVLMAQTTSEPNHMHGSGDDPC